MRKITLLLVTLMVMASCSITDRTTIAFFADYRPFADKGFLISPNAYTYDFDGLGELEITVIAAKNTKKRYEQINRSELVELAVKEAIKRGADGIVNFLITKDYVNLGKSVFSTPELVYTISGYCINREGVECSLEYLNEDESNQSLEKKYNVKIDFENSSSEYKALVSKINTIDSFKKEQEIKSNIYKLYYSKLISNDEKIDLLIKVETRVNSLGVEYHIGR